MTHGSYSLIVKFYKRFYFENLTFNLITRNLSATNYFKVLHKLRYMVCMDAFSLKNASDRRLWSLLSVILTFSIALSEIILKPSKESQTFFLGRLDNPCSRWSQHHRQSKARKAMKSHVETKLWIFGFDLVESILAFPGASMSNGLSLALYQQKVTATDRRKDFKVSLAWGPLRELEDVYETVNKQSNPLTWHYFINELTFAQEFL